MKLNTQNLTSTIMLTLIILSTIGFNAIHAQEPRPPPPKNAPPPLERKQFNGTFIFWDKQQNTTHETWNWTNQAWEFGPYPNFTIHLQNGTEVTDTNFVPLGKPFKVVISIQKNIFIGNTTLGRAGLQWHTELRTQNGTKSGEANCRMIYINKMETKYWNESNAWHVESFVFNQSEVTGPMEKPPPPPEQMHQNSFYQFDKASSRVVESSDSWRIEIVGSFNSTSTPIGPYWVNLEVTDQQDSWIDFGYRAWQEKRSPSSYGQIWANWETIGPNDFQIAVDTPVAISTILDSHGRPVKGWMFQTDPGESFTVQSKLYGAALKYRDIDGIGIVFRTGFGTWSANESYNSDVEIRLIKDLTTGTLSSVTYNRTNRNAYVYGPHKGWAYVNVTDWHMEYNATTGKWEWVNKPHLVWNETVLTDWHWEHSRLNQTEYTRDPNSPNIWIDTTTKWVSEVDPAFRMPQSYAVLNSADIALVKGIVTVNMSITFLPHALESNYWWNMVFQNMTYGRDWSQGWGEHVVTEWTSEPIYYVNGTVTGNQAWYVSKPTTPLYTMYNGQKYQLEQSPYITIEGVNLPIKVRTQYDQWRQEEWTEYLFRDPYDPSLGKEPRYYELLNGTKIYVQEAYQAIIRSLQLNCTNAYKMVGNEKILLPKGTSFSTYMNRAVQDLAEHFWDPVLQLDIVPYNYELINGTPIYRNEPFETQIYNATTNHWKIANPAYTESVTTLSVEYAGPGVPLNKTVVLLREPGHWQPLPDGSGYYLVMQN